MEADVLAHVLTHENERPEKNPNIVAKAVEHFEERHVKDTVEILR